MRISKFFALGVIFLAIVSFQSLNAKVNRVQVSNPPESSNYVVIGAFAIHKNAVNFTAQASKLSLNARFEMNVNRNLYYVYVMSTNDHTQAIEEALRLRKESPYGDTWVYHGVLGQPGSTVMGKDINPVTEQPVESIAVSDPSNPVSTEEAPIVSISEQPVSQEEPKAISKTKPETTVVDGKKFFFKLVRADDQKQVEGDVNVIDAERSRKIGTYAGNQDVWLADPKNKEGKISVVCEVFGYRKVQHDLIYDNPSLEGIEMTEDSATLIPFDLVRLQKGDIAVMYNVYFFKDAAIMRPESRYEVTSLLTMLKENQKYKIKIHGHTNGGAHGKIISLKEENDNFFALNDTKEGVGSAKKLSQERAEVIRNFLISNGVAENRMEVKAWGGKRPIYDKHSPQAQANVRVEIEILEN